MLRDNIWLGPANMTMRRQNTFNLDRVELLRGPSSVINGQGAVAGTVNMVTKQAQPTSTTDFSSMLSYGQFNTYQAAVGVNGPASDTVFYRFDVSRFGSNGFVDRDGPVLLQRHRQPPVAAERPRPVAGQRRLSERRLRLVLRHAAVAEGCPRRPSRWASSRPGTAR